MKIEINRIDKDFHFEAKGSTGIAVNIDAAPAIGGHNMGARPMELLLMGLGGCSGIDIVNILKKQKQNIEEFKIVVEAGREKDKTPSVFENIYIHFYLSGNIEKEKAGRAVELSMEKYCSAAAVIRKSVDIKYGFSVNE
ncbi:MAG: OsmC family protein [Bacteroidetes bacterium]|nr:OsmC family protein [Bacteroidota bacterium]